MPELRLVAEAASDGGDPACRPWQRPRWPTSALLVWLLAILTPSCTFLASSGPTLARYDMSAITLVGVALAFLSTVFMALTSLTNPGVLPRPSLAELRGRPRDDRGRLIDHPQTVESAVVVNGVRLQAKYCNVCGILRPPRASHCRETDRCIERWDHFCPWVGTAIGKRNYRWFVCFITTTTALASFVASGSLLHLRAVAATLGVGDGHSPVWLQAALAAPLSCVLLAYCVVAVCPLFMLCCYHAYLITLNQTTYENVKGVYDERVGSGSNPFDRGVLANCGEALCPACVPPPEILPATDWEQPGAAAGGEGRAGWNHRLSADLEAALPSLPPPRQRPADGSRAAIELQSLERDDGFRSAVHTLEEEFGQGPEPGGASSDPGRLARLARLHARKLRGGAVAACGGGGGSSSSDNPGRELELRAPNDEPPPSPSSEPWEEEEEDDHEIEEELVGDVDLDSLDVDEHVGLALGATRNMAGGRINHQANEPE
jgi:hypothetical protein